MMIEVEVSDQELGVLVRWRMPSTNWPRGLAKYDVP